MQPIRILIADDYKLIREGIKHILGEQKKYTVQVDEAENGNEAVELAKHFDYDLIMMDIKMPEKDGIEATREIKKSGKNTEVLALSMFDDENYIVSMINAGASGYILKNAGSEEFMKAISDILAGKKYYSSEVAVKLMDFYRYQDQATSQKPSSVSKTFSCLTPRERDVLNLLVTGATSREIAEKLVISPRTVTTHRENILGKLNMRNTIELIRFAIENKLTNKTAD